MQQIILDCDPGHDDAVALLLALGSPEVGLLGVTAVAGNQSVSRTCANAIRVLDCVGRGDVPVTAGASRPLVRELKTAVDIHGETGLDGAILPPPSREPGSEHAVDWIARTVSAATGPVTIVATGPLTNIALVLALHPEIASQLGRLVLMGGAIAEGNVTPAAEFNIWTDPEAAHRVFSSGLDITMVGLDVTHRALLTPAHLDTLALGGAAGRLVADLYRFFIPVHHQRYGWNGAPVHDAVAMAHVIDDTLLRTERLGVVVDTGPEPSRGRTYVDLWHQTKLEGNCNVAVAIDSCRFLELVVKRISTLD